MMAFIRVIALALALSGSTAWSSHPSESARNQYEAREDRPQPQLLTEATDHRPEVQDGFINNSTSSKHVNAPDLQVGCGDGFIKEKLQEISEVDKNKISQKRVPWGARRKRSYTPWSGQAVYSVPYDSINVWRPPTYQLSRPYYIPIYGMRGRPPIFYPPQPLYINHGVPKDNPVKRPSYQGPTYLPPGDTTISAPTTMKITNRFDGGDNKDEMWDWGDGNNQVTPRPERNGATQRPPQPTQAPLSTTTSVVPTRMTRPPWVVRDPPLIHNPTDTGGGGNTGGSLEQSVPESSSPETTVAPTRPPPTRRSTRAPRPRPSTERTVTSPPQPREPSRCVWAIISCCSTTEVTSFACFDQRGCPGAFWDSDPCQSDFAKAAISAALNYYNKK